jgi:large subunit ribosomal protein L10
MAKTRVKKESEVSDYSARLKSASAVAFADLTGLKVSEASALRRKAEAQGVSVRLAKKTLLALAVKDAGLTDVDWNAFQGASVTMLLTDGDQVAPAKLLSEVLKEHEAMRSLGGLLDLKWMTATDVKALAALPSKEVLIARVVGSIAAPMSGMVNVLQGNLRNLVYALEAIRAAKS